MQLMCYKHREMMKFPALLCLLPILCYGQFGNITVEIPIEGVEEIRKCQAMAKDTPVDEYLANLACVHAYYSKTGPRNLTAAEWELFENASKQRFGYVPPTTGHRVRREVRTLSAEDWNKFTDVIQQMYNDGTLRKFGLLHGSAINRYHKGAAFLPWHRVFLTHFEEEMRKINPSISLPYWDYTIDNNITQPFESAVWSECLFGEGFGTVKSGPFSYMYGGYGAFISRACAKSGSSKLINKIDIKDLLEFCEFEDITTGSGEYLKHRHNLELLHDGVHDWVGGDMGNVEVAAFDPIFYLHHAFIDYIWETFRENQIEKCGRDVENDYRPESNIGQKSSQYQGADDHMWGYAHLPNSYGLSRNWTKLFYSYAPQPSCPDNCGGQYLYCNKQADLRYPDGLCMTKTTEVCPPKPDRKKRAASENETELYPKLSCSAGDKLKGLPGDGRNRHTSEAECRRILEDEIDQNDESKCQDNLPSNDSGNSFGILFGSSFLGCFLAVVVIGGIVGFFACLKKRDKNYNKI